LKFSPQKIFYYKSRLKNFLTTNLANKKFISYQFFNQLHIPLKTRQLNIILLILPTTNLYEKSKLQRNSKIRYCQYQESQPTILFIYNEISIIHYLKNFEKDYFLVKNPFIKEDMTNPFLE